MSESKSTIGDCVVSTICLIPQIALIAILCVIWHNAEEESKALKSREETKTKEVKEWEALRNRLRAENKKNDDEIELLNAESSKILEDIRKSQEATKAFLELLEKK